MSLRQRVENIGQRMVGDRHWATFPEIEFAPHKGILPRCLYLEDPKDKKGNDVIIVGLNPGRAREDERDFFRQSDKSYGATVEFWKKHRFNYPNFFAPLRDLVRKSGLGGHIIWTELVHCQNKKDAKRRPKVNTIRYGVHAYLKKQIDLLPNAPIIAVGNIAFDLLSCLFFERKIIGVPHPSGRNPHNRKFYHKGMIVSKKLIHFVKSEVINPKVEANMFSY